MSSERFDAWGLRGASPIAEPRLRLNVVCPYYTMFPLSFPLAALADAQVGDAVLDPFCGRGTTAYAARLRGMRSVGVDADAVAVAVARAKLASGSPEQVEARLEELLGTVPIPAHVPTGDFWKLAFDHGTLLDICRVREALLTRDTASDVLLRAILLGVLHGPQSVKAPNYLSNQMPRTYATKPGPAVSYWIRTGHLARRVNIREVVRRRARYILRDVPDVSFGRVLRGDSRRLLDLGIVERFDYVVTSPPYLGMRSYRPDQWLRHWFLGGPEDVDYGMTDMMSPRLESFSSELAKVWHGVAKLSRPRASLTVRFGALPSVKADPERVMRASLVDTGWEVTSVRSAGTASAGKRQANHMNNIGEPADEIDLRARLIA